MPAPFLMKSAEKGLLPMEVKYENLVDKYKETLHKISVDAEAWKSFLESASYTYMQPFQNQVVLHLYKPGVKAVATKSAWQKLNRNVASDVQGLPVFNEDNSVGRVFDYQDTSTVGNPGILPWTVHKNKSGIALHNLLKRTGEKSLSDYVHKRVTAVLISDAKQSAPPELKECLEQSVQYVLRSRLGLEVDNLDTSGFAFASAYQNRPAALERLGHLLTKSLRQCLMPLRAVAYKMDMTMPVPEPQIKAPAVSSEPLTEAPREWGYYLIPDLKTWATNSSERTPIEHYETFEDVRERFAALRDQSYNKSNDLNDDGQPYAHLTLGLESKDNLSSVDILQVRADQNYLVEDFTRMDGLKNDPSFLEIISRVAKDIGFDRVRPYALEAGSYKAMPDISFTEWENPYFSVTPTTVSEKKNNTGKRASRRVEKQKADFEQLSLTSATAEVVQPNVQEHSSEYQLLDRLRADCEYFLGEVNRSEKHLWAGNVRDHILKMRELYNSLLIKPIWLTEANIDSYAKRMAAPYQVVVYHNLENGFDERREFQILEQAEQAAQKFVNGTMEGEDGFAYDGAGVYDLANKQQPVFAQIR